MIPTFSPGDAVITGDGTFAQFIRHDGPNRAIIMVGYDTRVVDPVALRRAE